MTREEIKAFGNHIVDKVFHRKGHEEKIFASVEGVFDNGYRVMWFIPSLNSYQYFFVKTNTLLKLGDRVEITIKKI